MRMGCKALFGDTPVPPYVGEASVGEPDCEGFGLSVEFIVGNLCGLSRAEFFKRVKRLERADTHDGSIFQVHFNLAPMFLAA